MAPPSPSPRNEPSSTLPASPAATLAVPSASAARAVAAFERLPDGTRLVRAPDCDTREVAPYTPGCGMSAIADRNVAVLSLRRFAAGKFTTELRAIDLTTGAASVLRSATETAVAVEDIRDDVVILSEFLQPGSARTHVRLLRSSWRDPARADLLDEYDLEFLGGGDTWNPLPFAKTNGRDIAWLRPIATGSYAIILRHPDGSRVTVTTVQGAAWFDLDDTGRVAVAAPRTVDGRPFQDLLLFDGQLRTLGSRQAADGGYVVSFGDWIGWAHGYGSVAPARDIELVSARGLPSRVLKPDRQECSISGRTATAVLLACPASTRLIDVETLSASAGPASVVIAFRRALLWRTPTDYGENPEVWRVTPL